MSTPIPAERPRSGPANVHGSWDVELSVETGRSASLVVRILGVLDTAAAPVLRWRLAAVIRAATRRGTGILLDLSGVLFLDLDSLDALLDFSLTTQHAGIQVDLFEPTPAVIRLLHEAHLSGSAWLIPVAVHAPPRAHRPLRVVRAAQRPPGP